jgi:hypothetical protein
MFQRLGLVAGVCAIAVVLWLLLQRPTARGGDLERGPAPAQARTEPDEPLAAPRAGTTSGDGTRVASEGTAAPALLDEIAPAPTRQLRVRVLDEFGAPVAAADVRMKIEDGESGQHNFSAVSGQDGLATFSRLDELHLMEGMEARVALAGLFEPPVEKSFSIEPWPAEPLELVMPTAGSIVVAVLDEEGEPLAAGKRDVELRLERELLPGARIWRERAAAGAPIESGLARFSAVGLGLRLSAHYDDRPDHAPAELAFEGPLRAGEEVRVELRLGEAAALLTLRLIAPDGRPLATAEVEAGFRRLIGGGSFSGSDSFRTDAEARLIVPLREGWQEGQQRFLTILHRPADGPECKAEIELSREILGDEDLGDVVLRARPVLVSGRAVDVEGNGVSGARITIEHHYSEQDWGHVTWGEVEADGSFAFYDNPPDSPLRLSVDTDEYQPLDPLPFVAGTSGLEIVLRRGVRLAGTVLAPEGMSPLAFEVTAVGANPRDQRGNGVDASGAFELTGLAPGTYDVEFALRPTSERLLVVPAVLARENGEPDPRLAEVDLRALARRVRLGVHTADGAPAAGGWAHVLGDPDAQQVAFVIEGGEAELLVPAAGSDVELSVPGHRLLRLEGLAADREVRLDAAFRVRCELAPDVPLPQGGSLQLRLSPSGPDVLREHYTLYRAHEQVGWFSAAFGDEGNTFDERRELAVFVQEPGTYDVTFHLVMGSEDGGSISYSVQTDRSCERITLAETSAGETFVLAPERDTYAQLLTGK